MKQLYKNQACNKNKQNRPISTGSQLVNFFSNCTDTDRAVIGFLLSMSCKLPTLYFAQETIAQETGVSRGHVNRVIKKLAHLGLIDKIYRHMTTCLYVINSSFNDPFILSKLTPIFPWLKTLFNILLIIPVYALSMRNVTQVINNKGFVSKFKLVSLSTEKYMEHNQAPPQNEGMQNWVNNPIPIEIQHMGAKYNFTDAAKLRMMALPWQAWQYAQKEISKASYFIKDPFTWLFAVALGYCDRNQMTPDWELPKKLLEHHGYTMQSATMWVEPNPEQALFTHDRSAPLPKDYKKRVNKNGYKRDEQTPEQPNRPPVFEGIQEVVSSESADVAKEKEWQKLLHRIMIKDPMLMQSVKYLRAWPIVPYLHDYLLKHDRLHEIPSLPEESRVSSVKTSDNASLDSQLEKLLRSSV
jgi:hypothetical protein